MFANLVRKYGVVPKETRPETESSRNTGIMNARLTWKLREYASVLRNLHQLGKPQNVLAAQKSDMMAEIYRMLCIHLGEPPSEFLWQCRDKDKNLLRGRVISPLQVFEKHISGGLYCLGSLI